MYFSDQGPSPQDAVDCFAMAAVGSYCDGNALTTTYQRTFMDCFIFLLQSQTHLTNLRAMRLFASLGLCRFTNSIVSARKLMCTPSSTLSAVIELTTHRCCLANRQRSLRITECYLKRVEADYWWQIYRCIVFLEWYVRFPAKTNV